MAKIPVTDADAKIGSKTYEIQSTDNAPRTLRFHGSTNKLTKAQREEGAVWEGLINPGVIIVPGRTTIVDEVTMGKLKGDKLFQFCLENGHLEVNTVDPGAQPRDLVLGEDKPPPSLGSPKRFELDDYVNVKAKSNPPSIDSASAIGGGRFDIHQQVRENI